MKQLSHPSLLILMALCARVVALGATLPESIAIVACASVYGLSLYLESRKQAPVSDELQKDVADLKSAIGALKIAKTFGR
jgi:hypothetical protein